MRDDPGMRTTLRLDLDVLQAARELAEVNGLTIGQVVSALARKGLEVPPDPPRVRNGVPLLAHRRTRPAKPTMRLVNELRDET
jgi:hypothetical protein